MISDLPPIQGISPFLLTALNERLRTLSTQLDAAQRDLAAAQSQIQKLQNQNAPVTSVNGKTGAVTLSATDVNAAPDTPAGTSQPFMSGDKLISGKHVSEIVLDDYGRIVNLGWS